MRSWRAALALSLAAAAVAVLVALAARADGPPQRPSPDYAELADEGPGTNPDGIPYLRDYNHSKEMFAGGLTYATPDDEWLVDVPSGLSVMFWAETQVMPFGGEAVETYSFDTAGMQSSIAIDKATGEIAARLGDVNAQLDTLAASFRRR